MFRKQQLPLHDIFEDLGYEAGFLCPCDASCVVDKMYSPCCNLLLDCSKVKKILSPCKEGVGNCVLCQCPLLEEDEKNPGYYSSVSALKCGHLYHSECFKGQMKNALLSEIGMAARVGRKLDGEDVVLRCAICTESNCLVHAFDVPPSFLFPLHLELISKYELEKYKTSLAIVPKTSKKRTQKSKASSIKKKSRLTT